MFDKGRSQHKETAGMSMMVWCIVLILLYLCILFLVSFWIVTTMNVVFVYSLWSSSWDLLTVLQLDFAMSKILQRIYCLYAEQVRWLSVGEQATALHLREILHDDVVLQMLKL